MFTNFISGIFKNLGKELTILMGIFTDPLGTIKKLF